MSKTPDSQEGTNNKVTMPDPGTHPLMEEPPPIKGYRTLSNAELEMINDLKELGEQIGSYVESLEDPQTVGLPNVDRRWVAIGKTHLQQGMMALTRAVARPESF